MKKTCQSLVLFLGMLGAAHAHSFPNAISPQEAKSLVEQKKAVLIDIREKDELSSGMAEPAQWYAKSSIDTDLSTFVKHLSQYKDKEIILYCRSGRRVSAVIPALSERGIAAKNMGGFQDWADAGFATKTP